MSDTSNVYLAIANAQWSGGEDGEVIARNLARALLHIMKEGTDKPPVEEFARLIKEDRPC